MKLLFDDLNSLFGFPPKVIWLRLGNLPTPQILKILHERYDELQAFIDDEMFGVFEISYLQKR